MPTVEERNVLEGGVSWKGPDAFGAGTAASGVSTGFPEATNAAVEILEVGGNAVDAAVAAAWALCVCEPSASGLGGQSTLLFHAADGTDRVIDGHSSGPALAGPDTVTPSQQRRGYRSCTIPSTPATLAHAQRRFGILTQSRVLEPAIRIAETGYAITPLQHRQLGWVRDQLNASPATADLFLRGGQPPPVGYVMRQPVLARTLRRLSERGVQDFYRGEISDAIADDMLAHDGLITRMDLANCMLPVEREPLRTSYRGLEVVSAPPPGGGLQLLVALKLLERYLADGTPECVESWYEAVARATYASFREREDLPLLPEDLTPQTRLWCLSETRLSPLSNRFAGRRLCKEGRGAPEGPGDTTHLTVADRHGNVVALTQSIQSIFGAKVANPKLGFVYNNYLAACPRSAPSAGPSRPFRPLSNAAPTIVLGGEPGRRSPVLALGGAGSRRIISSVLQVVSSVVDRGLGVEEAVAAPRVHALLSGRVWIEEPAASPRVVALLEGLFRKVEVRPRRSFRLGSVQALHWTDGGALHAAADPRRDGTAEVLP